DWAKRRAHILSNMERVMGPLPDRRGKVALDVRVTEEVKKDGYTRRLLTFAANRTDRVPAYLFLPDRPAGKRPAVLCLHPTRRAGNWARAWRGGSAARPTDTTPSTWRSAATSPWRPTTRTWAATVTTPTATATPARP